MLNAQSWMLNVQRQVTFAFGCALVLAAIVPASARPPGQEALTKSIVMEFVLLPPGTMTVGRFQPPYPKPPGKAFSAEEYARIEQAAKADSTPGFTVTIARSYYIGKYEVT